MSIESIMNLFVETVNERFGWKYEWWISEDSGNTILFDGCNSYARIDDDKLKEIDGTLLGDYINIEFDWYC